MALLKTAVRKIYNYKYVLNCLQSEIISRSFSSPSPCIYKAVGCWVEDLHQVGVSGRSPVSLLQQDSRHTCFSCQDDSNQLVAQHGLTTGSGFNEL